MNRPYRDAEVGSIAPAPGFQVVQSHGRSLSKDIDDSSAPGRDHDGDGARSDWDLLGYLMQIAESWTMLSRGKAVRSRRPVPGVDGGERNRRWNTGSGVGGAPVAKVTVTVCDGRGSRVEGWNLVEIRTREPGTEGQLWSLLVGTRQARTETRPQMERR